MCVLRPNRIFTKPSSAGTSQEPHDDLEAFFFSQKRLAVLRSSTAKKQNQQTWRLILREMLWYSGHVMSVLCGIRDINWCDLEILQNEKHQRPSRQDLEPDSSEEALGGHFGHRHVIVFHRQVEASMSAEAQPKKTRFEEIKQVSTWWSPKIGLPSGYLTVRHGKSPCY